MHATLMTLATTLVLSGLAAQDEKSRPLRFAWPTPARAQVIETMPGSGAPSIELAYVIEFDREEPGVPRKLQFRDFAFQRLGSDSLSGVERAQLAAMTVPGLVVRPSLVLDDRGRVSSTADYERVAREMRALMPRVAPAITPAMRTRIENQWMADDARQLAVGRVQADWEAWVGAWIGFVPSRVESEPESVELQHGDVAIPAETTITVLPDIAAGEHFIRLLSCTVAGGDAARSAMQRVVDAAERERVERDGGELTPRNVLRYEIEDRVEAVIDRRTMQPRSVHVQRMREVAIENEESSKRIEDRRFDFEWLDAGR